MIALSAELKRSLPSYIPCIFNCSTPSHYIIYNLSRKGCCRNSEVMEQIGSRWSSRRSEQGSAGQNRSFVGIRDNFQFLWVLSKAVRVRLHSKSKSKVSSLVTRPSHEEWKLDSSQSVHHHIASAGVPITCDH
jgi:hypothetical protein